MKKMNGAEVILRMLELHGVEHVFGLPGETTIGWYKEWQKSSDIKFVLTRDERTASYAAEAYAKITGKPAVLEAPSPGVTHCTPGITEAYLSSVPVIYFSSDIPINQDKKHGLTGVDQTAMYESICKESFYLTNVSEIPFLMRRAFRVATSGRPAPVHIRVPINIFHDEAEIGDLYADPDYREYPAHRPVADHGKIRKAIDLLLAAKKPVMVCGQGALISKAGEAVLELAELLQIPVGTTTPGKGTIPETHPLALRVIGARGGMEYSNAYVHDADAVFFIGSNTDSSSTNHWKLYGDPQTKAFIHLDIAEANTRQVCDEDVVGRIGGEEFCIFIPEAGRAEAVAERIRRSVSALRFRPIPARLHRLTVSIGVACSHHALVTRAPLCLRLVLEKARTA